jgi:Outer membrane efflux protein
MPHLRAIVAVLALAGAQAAALSGCAWFSPDGGMGVVQDVAGSALGKDVVAVRSPEEAEIVHDAVAHLLRRPLTASAAVEIALLNNRELQAAYNELGISEAALVKATLPPSPTFALSDIAGGGAFEFERQAVVSILALATLPARADIAGERFHQAQLKAAFATLRLAAQTRRAYYRAIAARALARFLEEATAAARRKRWGQQARPGPRSRLLRRPHRRDGRRPPARRGGARRARPPSRRLGRRSQLPSAQRVATAAAPASCACQCRSRRGRPPGRPADGADRGRRARQVIWTDRRDALHQPSRRRP